MPPVRTDKRNRSTDKNNSLHPYGFTDKSNEGNSNFKATDAKSKAVERKDVGKETDFRFDGANLVALSQVAAQKTGYSERQIKSVSKGVRDAQLHDDRHNWNGKYHEVIGTKTRKITFGCSSFLTDYHIDDLLAMGPKVCGNLTDFIFKYEDVSYGAHNSASILSDEGVVRLAKACPKLKKVQLQSATSFTDQSLLAFFEHCPGLTSLEISGQNGYSKIHGSSIDALRQKPSWVPILKKLLLPGSYDEKKFLKPVRDLTKAREGLVVKLVSVSETKKWGDWELEKYFTTYKKGRKQSLW